MSKQPHHEFRQEETQYCNDIYSVIQHIIRFFLEAEQIDYIFHLEKQLNINSLENLKKEKQ